jgi:hypothetical protein
MLVVLLAAATSGPAALAQATNDTGIPTETQERLKRGSGDLPWGDLIGLVGLLGLLGLKSKHAEDGYHPSSME